MVSWVVERPRFEPCLRSDGRRSVQLAREFLLGSLHYLSDLDGGPIAAPLPRDQVLELAADGPGADGALRAVARSLQRFVRAQAATVQRTSDDQLMERFQEIVARVGSNGMPRNQRYMNTAQIAKWLGLAPKTVRNLFAAGKLIGRMPGGSSDFRRGSVLAAEIVRAG